MINITIINIINIISMINMIGNIITIIITTMILMRGTWAEDSFGLRMPGDGPCVGHA